MALLCRVGISRDQAAVEALLQSSAWQTMLAIATEHEGKSKRPGRFSMKLTSLQTKMQPDLRSSARSRLVQMASQSSLKITT